MLHQACVYGLPRQSPGNGASSGTASSQPGNFATTARAIVKPTWHASAMRRAQRVGAPGASLPSMFEPHSLLLFVIAGLILNFTPGPDLLYITARSANQGRLEEAAAKTGKAKPKDRLRAVVGAFVDYGLEYPAFVDCAQTLMRRPGPELRIAPTALVLRGFPLLLLDRHAVVAAAIHGGAVHRPDLLGEHLGGAGGRRLERGLLVV